MSGIPSRFGPWYMDELFTNLAERTHKVRTDREEQRKNKAREILFECDSVNFIETIWPPIRKILLAAADEGETGG